jgi:hypothetical protein
VTQSEIFAADTTRNYGGGSRGAARFSADQNQFINDTVAENATMTSLASATGGHAFISTNDLTQAVKESINQGSNFYSLSYAPTDSTTDGKLRRIKIQVAHPGVTLAYPPTDILFRAGVVPMTPADKPEDGVAPHNTPTAKAKGPWRRYSINYQIDPAGLVFFRTADGKVHSDFDLIVYVFTPDGERMNVVNDIKAFTGGDDQVRDFFQHGIVQHLEVSVPAKGEYFLRIAVHDLHRDHYGAIEVPTSQVSSLVAADGPANTVAPTAAPAAAK